MAEHFKRGEASRAKGAYVEAVLHFKMAADEGYAPAIMALAQAHEKGQGVPKNAEQAAALYRLAAQQGIATAEGNAERVLVGPFAETIPPGRPGRGETVTSSDTHRRPGGRSGFVGAPGSFFSSASPGWEPAVTASDDAGQRTAGAGCRSVGDCGSRQEHDVGPPCWQAGLCLIGALKNGRASSCSLAWLQRELRFRRHPLELLVRSAVCPVL